MSIIYEPKGRAAEYAYLAINHYIGCDGKCRYCYVAGMPYWQGKDYFAAEPEPKENVFENLKAEVNKYEKTNKRVLLCFAGDPYPKIEGKLLHTRRILKLLKVYHIPFTILTKNGVDSQSDFDIYGPDDAFAVTLTFIDERKSLEYEPGASLPAARLDALKKAKELNIQTWASLEPVIDPEQTLDLIKITAKYVDLYKIGMLNHRKSDINWRKFGIAAVKLCRDLKKNYFIKSELAQYIQGFAYYNTDNRIIKNIEYRIQNTEDLSAEAQAKADKTQNTEYKKQQKQLSLW